MTPVPTSCSPPTATPFTWAGERPRDNAKAPQAHTFAGPTHLYQPLQTDQVTNTPTEQDDRPPSHRPRTHTRSPSGLQLWLQSHAPSGPQGTSHAIGGVSRKRDSSLFQRAPRTQSSRGSIGRPFGRQKTRSQSSQALPATRRSAACAALCRPQQWNQRSQIATGRLLPPFGSRNSHLPPQRSTRYRTAGTTSARPKAAEQPATPHSLPCATNSRNSAPMAATLPSPSPSSGQEAAATTTTRNGSPKARLTHKRQTEYTTAELVLFPKAPGQRSGPSTGTSHPSAATRRTAPCRSPHRRRRTQTTCRRSFHHPAARSSARPRRFPRHQGDTSRQGRWHNQKFAELASELGLDATKDPRTHRPPRHRRPRISLRLGRRRPHRRPRLVPPPSSNPATTTPLSSSANSPSAATASAAATTSSA